MRILAALVLLALVLVISVSAQFGPTTQSCCDVHYPKNQAIPEHKVVSYFTTSTSCFLRAHVFHTVAGLKICVNPNLPWVKKLVTKLDQKKGAA